MEVKETMLFGKRNPYRAAFCYLELICREYKIPVSRILTVCRTEDNRSDAFALIIYTCGVEQRVDITDDGPLDAAEKVLHLINETYFRPEFHETDVQL